MSVQPIEFHLERAKGIGGSDAAKIMAGDWHALWEEKTGRAEPEDLSHVLQVQIGIATEDLNRRWFAEHTGTLFAACGAMMVHPKHKFMRANLDGLCEDGAVFEAKHVSAFAKDDEIVERYFPQVQHYLAVADRDLAHLSVFFGNHRWQVFEIVADADYQARLIEREAEFWRHVEMDIAPDNPEAVVAEVAFDDMRTVDMTGHNLWAKCAGQWLDNQAAAKAFKAADKDIKGLVEADVKLAHGHGVKVTRAKNNALTVRVEK